MILEAAKEAIELVEALESSETIDEESEVGDIGEDELVNILKKMLPSKEFDSLSLEEFVELLKILNDATKEKGLNPRDILMDAFKQQALEDASQEQEK